MRGQPEIGLRFRPLSAKMCAHVNSDSALHNADADPDEASSDDEWLARAKQKGVRVRSQHGALVCVVAQDDLEETEVIPVCFMTWKSKASKRTILSTFGAQASACRDSGDLAEYTRAMLCEVVTGGRVYRTNGRWSTCPFDWSLTVRACSIVLPKTQACLKIEGRH